MSEFKFRSKPPRPSVRPVNRVTARQKPPLPKLYLDAADGPAQKHDDITLDETTSDVIREFRASRPPVSPLVRVIRPSYWNQLRVMLSVMLARLAARIAP